MKNIINIIILMTIVIPSLLSLLTIKNLNNKMLFTTICLNLGSLIMIFKIQSIGYQIDLNSCLIIIILNNILISVTKLIFNNLKPHNKLKIKLGSLLAYYIKSLYIYPNFILRKITVFLNKSLDLINNRINNVLFELITIEPLKLINKEKDVFTKHTVFTFENSNLLDHNSLFTALFLALSSQSEFKKLGKKIMIVAIVKEDKTFYIHKNIFIDENTTVDNYLDKIEGSIHNFYESGYPLTDFNILQVKIWEYIPHSKKRGTEVSTINQIHQLRRNFHISSINNKVKSKNFNLIKPLVEPQSLTKTLIAAIDIETIELNDNQAPISISLSYYSNENLITIFELINYNLLLKNPEKAVKLLWENFINKIIDLKLNNYVIFSHNLGSFDGYFLYKGLLELPEIEIDKVNSIIDDLHSFISVDMNWKDKRFIYKDSLRVFSVSLEELCKTFEVETKLHTYNPLFNKISLFKDKILLKQFIDYSKQDSICLLKALTKAQKLYIDNHKVDIATIWSTSTLSFKIFRQKFLNINIPILSKSIDKIIRLAYIGGSTDYYLKYGENLKHYDVNSLYPKAMCNPMPIKFIDISYGPNLKLNNVFGFAEARITAPNNLEIPLLPFKVDNETIHPIGSWIGLYFTEELKAVAKHGYKIELIKVYNFTSELIFNDYIEYWYNIKKTSTGSLRFIAKMHLNTLYGYFGRKNTLIETKNVYTKDLLHYYGKHTIFSEIQINDNISTLLMSSNFDYNLINEINEDFNLDLSSSFRLIKSHVGIAAAVTSYARIEMIKFKTTLHKLGIKLYYTDTDSMFIDGELPTNLVGDNLGQMKDELKDGYIKKAYFLGIKKYGYIDNKDAIHSIFSGVERDSLTWNEIEQIANGLTIVKQSQARFYKNLNKLTIKIKNSLETTIKFNTRKKLVDNKYLPIKINVKILIKLDFYLRIIKNKIINLINKHRLNKLEKTYDSKRNIN